MQERGIVATRQLAKRQITWLRSEKELNTFNAQENNLSSVKSRVKAFVARYTALPDE
jgi:tRNA dimethylallyltransferase